MQIRWAMAGRNREKLENVRAELLPDAMGAQQVDILEADVMDPASLRDLASSTHVVITMVGPYALYGRPVVQVRGCSPFYFLRAVLAVNTAKCWQGTCTPEKYAKQTQQFQNTKFVLEPV